jgi:hypothetical protein
MMNACFFACLNWSTWVFTHYLIPTGLMPSVPMIQWYHNDDFEPSLSSCDAELSDSACKTCPLACNALQAQTPSETSRTHRRRLGPAPGMLKPNIHTWGAYGGILWICWSRYSVNCPPETQWVMLKGHIEIHHAVEAFFFASMIQKSVMALWTLHSNGAAIPIWFGLKPAPPKW